MAFDNEFDEAMQDADDTIWSAMGIFVLVNGSGPVRAIYEEAINEFDAMSGKIHKLSFLPNSGVKPRKNDTITFVSSGQTRKVSSGPFTDGGNIMVIL